MNQTQPSSHRAPFAATRWSVIVAAGDRHADTARRQALEVLARTYWMPLYAFARRLGQSPQQSEDLTQGYFTRLIEKNDLQQVDRARGKFRSFLLASFKHFIAHEWDKAKTQKRGGGAKLLSLSAAEARYASEPADTMTPERLFDRRWALAMLDQVMIRLRNEYQAKQQLDLFEALKNTLTGDADEGYAPIAGKLGLTEGAVRVAAHRLRKRYRVLLRDEVLQTVVDPALVDEELRNLMNSL